jgi:hypothetical protein
MINFEIDHMHTSYYYTEFVLAINKLMETTLSAVF